MSNEFIIAVQVRVIIEGQGCLLVKRSQELRKGGAHLPRYTLPHTAQVTQYTCMRTMIHLS